MKKLYEEFFAVPKKEKVREKVIQVRLAMTIGIVVFCLLAMSFSAYAYFTSDVSSSSNFIQTANFETKLKVQVIDGDGNVVEEVKPVTSNYKTFKLSELRPGEWYTVTVTPTDRSSAGTGFIIISATGCEKTYHTQQLGVDERVKGKFTPELHFRVMITEKTDVMFAANWGTSSYYPDFQERDEERYVENDEDIKLVISSLKEPNQLTQAPTQVTIAPTQEVVVPTEETAAPTEETAAPTEATVAPTEETAVPTEETVAPTEATAAPTEETVAPTEATAVPTEVTEIPTEVTVAPTEETEAPTEATEAPTEVTAAPTEATVAPTEETTEPPAVWL